MAKRFDDVALVVVPCEAARFEIFALVILEEAAVVVENVDVPVKFVDEVEVKEPTVNVPMVPMLATSEVVDVIEPTVSVPTVELARVAVLVAVMFPAVPEPMVALLATSDVVDVSVPTVSVPTVAFGAMSD